MLAISESKRAYGAKDMLEWTQWWGVDFVFNSVFPLRTVLPLRVHLLEPKTFHLFFQAGWVRNANIGDPKTVIKILNEAGFPGEDLVRRADGEEVKEKLKSNTLRAKEEGVFGVPTFQINGRDLVWGQDKLNIVEDLLCGWRQDELSPKL